MKQTSRGCWMAALAVMMWAVGAGTVSASESDAEKPPPQPAEESDVERQPADGVSDAEDDGEDCDCSPAESLDDQQRLDRAFDEHLEFRSAVEIELGLRLYDEGDDYRAISSLKKYRLLADEPRADRVAHLLIGDIYRRNEYPQLAIEHYQSASQAALEVGDADFGAHLLSIQEMCASLKAYATCHPMLRQFEEAVDADDEAVAEVARFQREFVEMVLGQPPRADLGFDDPGLARASAELVERQELFDQLPTKSPVVAGILSAVIPGAGQAYVGRWFDGALALGMTGLFAGATAYSHFGAESVPMTVASGLLTAGFYTGNIANAAVDARRHNAQLYDDFFDTLHRDLWPRLYFRVDGEDVDYDYRFDWPGHVDPDEQTTEPAPIPGML